MLASAKGEIGHKLAPISDDVTIGELLDALSAHSAKPLVFSYGGRTVKPGYHVTEVKAGRFASLDCGASPESWTEIFVQLWDVDEGERTHMPAGKFAAIIRKVADHVPLDASARLTFEVSDGVEPMQLHRASLPEGAAGNVHIALTPRTASCKPRDRWLEAPNRPERAGRCCGSAAAQPCCV
jgi:hypothetical protein